MNKLIIGSKFSRITAKKIAKQLDGEYTEQLIDPSIKYNLIFRYGNSHCNLPDNFNGIIINKALSINSVANKYEARKTMIQNQIKCPIIIDASSIDKNKIYPLIARPHYHWRGKNFFVISNIDQAIKFLNRRYYLQEIIDQATEYRIFMWNNRFFEVNEKVYSSNVTNLLIKNHANGWYFKKISYLSLGEILLNYCRKIPSIFNLNWLAIDCCKDKKGQPYIFEINSAPSLNERKIEKLCCRISEECGT